MLSCVACATYDVTIVSSVIGFANGLERVPLMVADLLGDKLSINFVPPTKIDFKDVPVKVARLIRNSKRHASKVAILFDPLWYPNPGEAFYKRVPYAPIKLAYSMIESTQIPSKWTQILNSSFDAVIVPDAWLVPVYQRSGVHIPIFVLPIGLYLDDFLSKSVPLRPNRVFTFGLSAAGVHGKNHELLINAFLEEFGQNNPHVRLRLHSRGGSEVEKIKAYVKRLKVSNVEFIHKVFSQKEYVDFMASIDCYVTLSMGEGYSITPREALALGRPVIISANTAHQTIVDAGFVRAVPAAIPEKAFYSVFGSNLGYKFNCDIKHVKMALRDVYSNYAKYRQKALAGRGWVKRYNYKMLESSYHMLLRPSKIVLGSTNQITDTALITTSRTLYNKYKSIGC